MEQHDRAPGLQVQAAKEVVEAFLLLGAQAAVLPHDCGEELAAAPTKDKGSNGTI